VRLTTAVGSHSKVVERRLSIEDDEFAGLEEDNAFAGNLDAFDQAGVVDQQPAGLCRRSECDDPKEHEKHEEKAEIVEICKVEICKEE
jgi:hypothetical protein